MAINDDRSPSAEASARVCVVVKLAERALRGAKADTITSALSELRRVAPDAEFKPYFGDEEQLHAAALAPFNRYVAAEAEDREIAAALVRNLQRLDLIEEAYVEGGPVPPPINAADDWLSGSQGYLDAAPTGIDARWAWSMTDGAGIRFVDLERGWTLNHEDLAAADINILSGINRDFHGHGTAVLGEVLGVDNALGGVGIAPGAKGSVVSQWRNDFPPYSTSKAILSAAQAMSAGDVLLLEAQTNFAGLDFLPVEVETLVFDAIRHVTNAGIIVVEAAGNGGHDLDTFVSAANRRVLNRGHADFRDSGAIMVGAASSTVPHSRLGFSCHGSRIDCYGWGENIVTTGDGWTGTSTTEYTTSFNGTSGASPMVAAAAVLIQSWQKKRGLKVYSPERLRQIMSSAAYNTASANPATDRIGVMPNLRSLLEIETVGRFGNLSENYARLSYILFGLIDDSPGMVWIPGRGPVPVDPDWLPVAKTIAAPKRDLLTALAVNEIIPFIEDQTTRTKLADAAVEAMHGAVDRISHMR